MRKIRKMLKDELGKLDGQIAELNKKRGPLAQALEALSGGKAAGEPPAKAMRTVVKKGRKKRTAAQRKGFSSCVG